MHAIYSIERHPSKEDVLEIEKRIHIFNMAKTGDLGMYPIAIFARNAQGKIIGGITGNTLLHSLFINTLFVDSETRSQGIGSKLMKIAEDYAKEEDINLIHLDTFSFQAPLFYQKLGYMIFGELDYKEGIKRYFLKKNI